MKKMIPLILKGLGVLLVVGGIGFSVYTYINTLKLNNDNLIIKIDEMNRELNDIREAELAAQKAKQAKYLADLEKQVKDLTKENQNLKDQIKDLSE